MKNFCRIRIVGQDLGDLGLTPYENILSETNSFILDLTKQLTNQKAIGITEYPTLNLGKKRISQTVIEPESISIEGALSEYSTNKINNKLTVSVELFRKFLNTLIENAVILDVESESKSYYNYIIQTMNVSQTSMGTVHISLSLREVWMISNAVSEQIEVNKVEEGPINDQIKEQSLKQLIKNAFDKLLISYGNTVLKTNINFLTYNTNTFEYESSLVANNFLADFSKEIMNIGLTYTETYNMEFDPIEVTPIKNYLYSELGKNYSEINIYRNSEIMKVIPAGGMDSQPARVLQYPSLINSTGNIAHSVKINENTNIYFYMPDRTLSDGDNYELKNQYVYYNNTVNQMGNLLLKVHASSQLASLNIRYNGLTVSSRRGLAWDISRYLGLNINLANSLFKIIVGDRGAYVDLVNSMLAGNKNVGVIYFSYYYQLNNDGKTAKTNVNKNLYIIRRVNFYSANIVKLASQVLYEYFGNKQGSLSEELMSFAEKDG